MTRRALLVGVLVAPVAVPAAVRAVAAKPWQIGPVWFCTSHGFTGIIYGVRNRLTGEMDYWRDTVSVREWTPTWPAWSRARAERWRDVLNAEFA